MSLVEPGWWEQHGYLVGRRLDDRYWLCVHRMMFTWRVMVCDEMGVQDFCCWSDLAPALECWARWDGTGLPPGEWIRHHRSGYRHRDGKLYEEDGITEVAEDRDFDQGPYRSVTGGGMIGGGYR